MTITKEQVLDALRNVDDPDLKKDLVTLNMIRDIEINGKEVSFSVVLTTPACPLKSMIHKSCVEAIHHYVDKEAKVNVNMTSNVTSVRPALKGTPLGGDDQPMLPDVKNIIAVASGKGGVGKSTIAANLAVALAKQGAKVGLVDADIYGPSMPMMFNLADEKPAVTKVDGKSLMVPVESYGVKILSIGFFAEASQAIPWRGPMASRALIQMFTEADWGTLDYMIIDLPPGTGDIHLTLVQSVPVTGALIVTTPQPVALADAEKGINMFKMPAINVPVLGLIENMSYFTPAELPENKYYIFGKDGGKKLAKKAGVPLLAQIPLVQSIRESGDAGKPEILQDNSTLSNTFMDMAKSVAQRIAVINANVELEHEKVLSN